MKQISLKRIANLPRRPKLACAAVSALTLLAGGASAQAVPARFLITPDLVVAAMTARQLSTEAVQIKLAAPVTSSSPDPLLEIENITRTSEFGAQLRMACHTKRDCLPFYAVATWPQSSTIGASAVLNQALSVKSVSAPKQTGKTSPSMAGSPIMRSGTPATLVIEDEKVHIRMQVVCVEDGVTGASIRVVTPDHKQSYRAEVLAPNLLKGSF